MYFDNIFAIFGPQNYPYLSNIGIDEWLFVQKYINIFCSRFGYDKLPDDTQKIVGFNSQVEGMMFFAPALAWFEDSTLGLQCLPVTGQWKFNITGFPTEWTVFGFNNFRKDLTENNSVIMPNDAFFSIPFLHVMYNLKYIMELDKTHLQNIRRQRQPLIMEIDEDEKKSAETFVRQLSEFSDYIKIRIRGTATDKKTKILTESRPFNSYAFDSKTDFIGDKLTADFQVYENRIFQYFGYNNTSIEKKERLLVDEVNAGNEIINSYYNSAKLAREKAIEKVNKMFKVNISLKDNKEEFAKNVQSSLFNRQNVEESNSTVQHGLQNDSVNR